MDRVEISMLCDCYGELLTKKQITMLRMRYDEDLSFGEIAEQMGVSRQAVLDGILKGEKHLKEFEEKLKLLSKSVALQKSLNELSDLVDGNEALKARIEHIKEILEG